MTYQGMSNKDFALPKSWYVGDYWLVFVLLALVVLTMTGCNKESRFKPYSRNECFELGGVRYEAGESNGNVHSVCIYEKR